MSDVPFQADLKIRLAENALEKCTLTLSPTGDIQLVEGKDKLVEQLTRAVVNDQTVLKSLMNSRTVTTRSINALFTTIMRSFRQNQIDEVNKSDRKLTGFNIYRKASGTNDRFTRVAPKEIYWKFQDSNLSNGFSYDYAITKVFGGTYESAYIDQFTITPSSFSQNQILLIGNYSVIIPTDRGAVIYVDFNRKYKASEIVNSIISINAYQDQTEPRKWSVNIIIQTLDSNKVSISTGKLNPVTGK
jgi:hypothetical protein